jgi:uridine phosphorylase
MIDFLIRELREIVDGPLTFIQIGTAASPINLPLGTAVIVQDAVAYQPDFDNFTPDNPFTYQIFANPVQAASAVVAAIEAGLRFIRVPDEVGRVASTPSFTAGIAAYPAPDGINFKTDQVLEKITDVCGPIASLEMDTYPLLWMSRRATGLPIWSGCVSLVGSDLKGNVLPADEIEKRLEDIARVMLAQLAALQSAR